MPNAKCVMPTVKKEAQSNTYLMMVCSSLSAVIRGGVRGTLTSLPSGRATAMTGISMLYLRSQSGLDRMSLNSML